MTCRPFAVSLLSLAVLLVVASAATALDLGGHDRDGTVIGLTFGYGWNSISLNSPEVGNLDSGNISSFSGGFRVGWASSDYFIGSIGMYGWKKSYDTVNYTSTTATNYHFMLEGYFFPRGEGFWIKGGVGRGTLDFNATAPILVDSVIFNEKNWSLSTGAGYEFRVSDRAAVGVCYDLFYLPLGDISGFTDVSELSQAVSLNLHFYMN
jgi:hypothetical protein